MEKHHQDVLTAESENSRKYLEAGLGGGWGVCRNGSELWRGDDGGTRGHGHVPAALKQKEDVQGPFRHAGGLPW